jgi:hypothetical protein
MIMLLYYIVDLDVILYYVPTRWLTFQLANRMPVVQPVTHSWLGSAHFAHSTKI